MPRAIYRQGRPWPGVLAVVLIHIFILYLNFYFSLTVSYCCDGSHLFGANYYIDPATNLLCYRFTKLQFLHPDWYNAKNKRKKKHRKPYITPQEPRYY